MWLKHPQELFHKFKIMIVKMLEKGSCAGHKYNKGEVVDLPENVVKALDPRSYKKVEDVKAQDGAPSDKQVKKAENKQVKKAE